MAVQELKSKLAKFTAFRSVFSRNKIENESLFSWYWTILSDYVGDKTSISSEEFEVFNEFFPNFTTMAKRYGATRADEIRSNYIKAREPYVSTLRAIEDAAPHVLYMKGTDKTYVRTNSPFIPFGKLEEPKEATYFLDALLETNQPCQKPEDAQYIFFKAHIYTNLVARYPAKSSPAFYYIEESALESLREKYPELTQKFEDEALQYLDKLGYYEAFEKFVTSKHAEHTELASLLPEESRKLVYIAVNGKQVKIEYD